MERSALGGDFTGAREGFEGGIGGLLDHPRFIHGMERERERERERREHSSRGDVGGV